MSNVRKNFFLQPINRIPVVVDGTRPNSKATTFQHDNPCKLCFENSIAHCWALKSRMHPTVLCPSILVSGLCHTRFAGKSSSFSRMTCTVRQIQIDSLTGSPISLQLHCHSYGEWSKLQQLILPSLLVPLCNVSIEPPRSVWTQIGASGIHVEPCQSSRMPVVCDFWNRHSPDQPLLWKVPCPCLSSALLPWNLEPPKYPAIADALLANLLSCFENLDRTNLPFCQLSDIRISNIAYCCWWPHWKCYRAGTDPMPKPLSEHLEMLAQLEAELRFKPARGKSFFVAGFSAEPLPQWNRHQIQQNLVVHWLDHIICKLWPRFTLQVLLVHLFQTITRRSATFTPWIPIGLGAFLMHGNDIQFNSLDP